MKVIAVEHNWDENYCPPSVAAHLMADSAIMRTDKPFFIPDVTPRLVGRLAVAMRISRLGKFVASKFVHRYCNEFTAAIVATAENDEERLRQSLVDAIDGSLMLGDWIVDDRQLEHLNDAQLTMMCDGKAVCQASTQHLAFNAATVVESVSRYCTLKTGDIIVLAMHPYGLPLTIGQRLHAAIDDKTVLDIRIR
ncbi:MAG: fumarylacetoacetate hydrolase family protein [Muribaculaceae bacterium]|nr:fumarylacetoacetate hydrolase family protein [Muribaculaceae bacterium]